MNRNEPGEKTKELVERYNEALREASTIIKESLSDRAFMEFLEIIRKTTRSKGGVYISAIGEKSKKNAAAANYVAANVNPKKVWYTNFTKTDETLQDIYKEMKEGIYGGKNLIIIPDPDCKRKPAVIRRLMKKEINRLMREAKKEGTRVHLPQNVIYLNYVRDRRSYLDKIALYPFDSIPKPVFRKRPNGY